MKIKFTFLMILFFILFSCNKKQNSNSSNSIKNTNSDIVNIDTSRTENSHDTTIQNKFETQTDTQKVQIQMVRKPVKKSALLLGKYKIPSPNEILLKDSNFVADYSLLYKIDISTLNTEYEQSVILGLISSDLVYATIFGNKTKIKQYYTLSAKLADKLGFGSIINIDEIKKIDNQTNFDTIQNYIFEKIRNITNELSNKKSYIELSYVLYGQWIENNYLLVNTLLKNSGASDTLYQKLFEQYAIIDNIIEYDNFVLSDVNNYDVSLNINAIINDLTELKKFYDKLYSNQSKIINSEELSQLNAIIQKYRQNILLQSNKKIEMQVKKKNNE